MQTLSLRCAGDVQWTWGLCICMRMLVDCCWHYRAAHITATTKPALPCVPGGDPGQLVEQTIVSYSLHDSKHAKKSTIPNTCTRSLSAHTGTMHATHTRASTHAHMRSLPPSSTEACADCRQPVLHETGRFTKNSVLFHSFFIQQNGQFSETVRGTVRETAGQK